VPDGFQRLKLGFSLASLCCTHELFANAVICNNILVTKSPERLAILLLPAQFDVMSLRPKHASTHQVTLTYITSGFAGNVLSALFVHGRVSVGASGAFMGLLGATMSSILINWKLYPRRTPSLVAVIFFGAINLAFGLMPLVDNFMHIGGATTGFLLGNLLMIRPEFGWITRRCFPAIIYDTDDMPIKSTKHAILKNAMWIISLILFLSAITAGLLALFQGTPHLLLSRFSFKTFVVTMKFQFLHSFFLQLDHIQGDSCTENPTISTS